MKTIQFSKFFLVLLSLVLAACSDGGSKGSNNESKEVRNTVTESETDSTVCENNTIKRADEDQFVHNIQFGKVACVKQMLDAGFDPNTIVPYVGIVDRTSPIFIALDSIRISNLKDKKAIVKLLVDRGARLDVKIKDTSLAFYILERSFIPDEVVEYLFSLKDMPLEDNSLGFSTLTFAISKGKEQIARTLILNGANFEKDLNGTKPIWLAMDKHMFSLANLMVQKGADISSLSSTGSLLDRAFLYYEEVVQGGNKSLVQNLIKRMTVSDLNRADKYGHVELHTAVDKGLVDIAELILAAGANVNAAEFNGWTALSMAATLNNKEMIKLLLSYKADTSIKDNFGQTPLFSSKDLEALNLLLTKENIDVVNKKRTTILGQLVLSYLTVKKSETLSMIKKLLDSGADARIALENNSILNSVLVGTTYEDTKRSRESDQTELLKLLLKKLDINMVDEKLSSVFHVVDTEAEALELFKSETRADLTILNINGEPAIVLQKRHYEMLKAEIEIDISRLKEHQEKIDAKKKLLKAPGITKDEAMRLNREIIKDEKIKKEERERVEGYKIQNAERAKVIKLIEAHMQK